MSNLAFFYDGKTSKKHEVTLTFADNGFHIFENGVEIDFWESASLQLIDNDKPIRIAHLERANQRLVILDEDFGKNIIITYKIAANTKKLDRKNTSKVLLWSGVALVSTVLFLLLGLPYMARFLAPFVPNSVEVSFGKTIDGEITSLFGGGREVKSCTQAEGKAVFDKLVSKLEKEAYLKIPLKAKLLNLKMVNAFATTGGHIYIMDGLIQKAESPDQLAGVIAHEIGHLKHQHVMQNIIEAGGIGLFLGTIFGDFSGSTALLYVTKTMISSAHGRAFETESDVFGVELLKKAGGDPRALATMLEAIDPSKKGETPAFFEWMRSHPITEGRAANIRKAAGEISMRPPILTGEEWVALKNACKQDAPLPPVVKPKEQRL